MGHFASTSIAKVFSARRSHVGFSSNSYRRSNTSTTVAHRDLKPENVLLDRYMNVRLSDFGLSNMFAVDAPEMCTPCGSPAYASPEIVFGGQYTKATDLWSLGVLPFGLATGKLPFRRETIQNMLHAVAYSEPVFVDSMSDELVDLLHNLLAKDPSKRATIADVKASGWLNMNGSVAADKKWSVTRPQPEVVAKMGLLGVDVKVLQHALLTNVYDDEHVLYDAEGECDRHDQ